MTKLILASVLAVGLSFPLTSQAELRALGVSLPVQRSEVSDNIHGGYVATSAGDSLTAQKTHSDKQNKGSHVATSAVDSFVVQKLSGSAPQS